MRGWIAALVLAGCGGGGDEGSSGTAGETGEPLTEIALEDFYGEAEAAWCTWQVACHQYGVEARCADVNHMEQRLSMRRLSGVGPDEAVPLAYRQEAVEVGRVEYDGEAAAQCLAYVRTRSCEEPYYHAYTEEERAGEAACEAVFRGRMGRNGPCLSASECAEASVCGFDPTCVEACCVGACRVLAEPLAVGEACTAMNCVADAYCAVDPNTFMPTVCTASPTVGQECPMGQCGGGALCDFDGEKPVCVAPKAAGADCYYDQQCAQPAVCAYTGGDYGECTAPADQGEKCGSTGNGVCLRFDNYCDEQSGVCELPAGKGESCSGVPCAGDFFCSGAQGQRCVPVADAGEPCGYDQNSGDSVPCSGDHVCEYGDGDRGTCRAPGAGSECPVPEDPLANG